MSTRDLLVDTMGDLIWERGYADTSPRDVRERSGVGQGSLYHHFPTKRDLGVAAIERNVSEVLPAALELGGVGDPMERITAYLSRPRNPLKGCRVGRLTQDPQVRDDPALLAPVTEAFTRMRQSWESALQDAKDAGQIRGDLDVSRLAHTLMAVIQGGYVLAMAQQDPSPFFDAVQGALDLIHSSASQAQDLPNGNNEEREHLS